jgi:rubrerythrin
MWQRPWQTSWENRLPGENQGLVLKDVCLGLQIWYKNKIALKTRHATILINTIRRKTPMNFGSIDEILTFAIGKENEAVEFYSNQAAQASRASLKEIFENFAREEKKHAALLSDISGNKEKIASYEFKKIPDLKISDYMVETEYKEGMPMPEILKVAMKREEKAVKLYQTLADQTDNAEARKVFLMLVQEESKHKLGLESMYDDYLADQDN